MSLNTQILEIFPSNMPLEEIAVKDTESADQKQRVGGDSAVPSKTTGHISPYVKINGHVFDHNDIEQMVFDESNMLPTINITIRDTTGVFKSAYFPRSNPILSLYIRSKHDKLKPIRCDFLITSIDSDSSIDPENHEVGKNMTLMMSGSLFVPGIYNNNPQSYHKMTSYETLQELSADMRLGFATNEDRTNDSMTWIKPLIRRSNFIQHVVQYAFKDDVSFYMGFISRHYDLTFINMGNMFQEDMEFDKMFENILTYGDLLQKESDKEYDRKTQGLFLTNYSKMTNTDMHMQEFRPESIAGASMIRSGYIRNSGYYDQMYSKNYKENFINLDVKPISNTQAPSKKEPDELIDELASNFNGEWCGIDYNNGHENFNFALIQNEHNNQDIRKMTLYVKQRGINMNLIRGMRIPVLIFRQNQGDDIAYKSRLPDDEKPKEGTEALEGTNISKDKWLSGYYVIGSIRYTYDCDEEQAFSTEIRLLRMNWPNMSATLQVGNDPNQNL